MVIPSWLVIGIVNFALLFGINQLSSEERQWFFSLRRPKWLTFESLIPIIWIVIFICLIISASIVWDLNPWSRQSWFLMGRYSLVIALIASYTKVMCLVRSLTVGTLIGALGFLFGIWLAVLVFPVSIFAFMLLLPYLLWSPIGTYVTWAMIPLNRGSA